MEKSVKFKNNIFLDSTSITHDRKQLSEILNQKEVYSTDEQIVGRWIDGKPIYRKVIVGTNYQSGMETYIATLYNLDILINVYGMAQRSNGNNMRIPNPHYSDSTKIISVYSNTNGQLALEVGSGLTNITKYHIVCEYTKK